MVLSPVALADSSKIQFLARSDDSSGSTKTDVDVEFARFDVTAAPIPTKFFATTDSRNAPSAGTPALAESGIDRSEAGARVTRVKVEEATTPLSLDAGIFAENGLTDSPTDTLLFDGFARITVD
jgi:hypothetical protein